MVKILLLLSLLTGAVADAASLTARLDKTTAALGEPVSLTVQARGLNLDEFDAGPLGAVFDVFARTLSRSGDGETLVLKLYPRAVGAVEIPPLSLDDRRTAALRLTVNDGSERVPRVTANWTLDPAMPQVNQPARLSLAICDDGSLQWQRPDLPTHAGRVVRALGEDEGEAERSGEACTLHRFHWALLATQGGAASLAVPMLDASRFGERLRFPAPSLSFHAAALPAWLPAYVPPVSPLVSVDPLPARWPLERPLSWRFEVVGGYSADGLKSLLDLQLRETPALGMYPPLIEAVTPDDPNSPLSRHAVTLFLQPRSRGPLSLPTLRLPWYDPVRGQLASAVITGNAITVFDPRWKLVRQVAAGLAALLLLAGLVWQASRTLRWRLARRRSLQAIRLAGDATGLARAVRRFSLSGQPAASSLGEWLHQLRHEVKAGDVAEAVRQLERACFGRSTIALAELKEAFVQALKRVRPKARKRGSRGMYR